ncbi:MAG: hypothetical protein AAF564_26735, partial [Bacteroidota bacterium]
MAVLFLVTSPPTSLFAQAVIDWEPLNQHIEGGAVTLLWQSPSGAFFAGSRSSSLFRSPGVGEPWEPVALPKNHPLSLKADPTGRLYLWSHEGLFESENDGVSWSKSTLSISPRSLLFTPDGVTFASTDEGIYQRNSSQDDWQLIKQWTSRDIGKADDDEIVSPSFFKMRADGSLVAGVGSRIFLSEDGNSWQCLSVDASGTCWHNFICYGSGHCEPADVRSILPLGNDLLIYTEARYGARAVRYLAEQNEIVDIDRLGCSIEGFYDTPAAHFAQASACCTMGHCGGNGLYQRNKNDSLASWLRIDDSALTYRVAPDASWICAGSYDGVKCSFDGAQSWQPWNNGLSNRAISTLHFNSAEALMVGTGYGLVINPRHPEEEAQHLLVNQRPGNFGIDCLSAPRAFLSHVNDSLYAEVSGRVYHAGNVTDLWEMTPRSISFGYINGPLYDEKPLTPALPSCGFEVLVTRTPPFSCRRRHRGLYAAGSRLYQKKFNAMYRSSDGFHQELTEITPPINPQKFSVMGAHNNGTLVLANETTLYVST